MKRFVLLMLIISLSCFSSCSYESDRYDKLKEDYEHLQNEYEELYMSVRRIREDTLSSPRDIFSDAVYDNDPHRYFLPGPDLSSVDATLYFYLDGSEPGYSMRARYAYAIYQQYAADMAAILTQLDKEFAALLGD